jgi:hypothetical protein
MKNDKFLIGIIAGIVLLVVAALALVLLRSPKEDYVADDSPEGAVQNYFLAIQRRDYEKAHAYLSDELKQKPDLDQFIRDIGYQSGSEAALKIGEVRLGDAATQVDVTITTYSGGGIFDSSSYTNSGTVVLRATADGQWKLLSYPSYWGYNWDEPPTD